MFAKTFMELLVWKKAHQFVIDVYKATEQFPKKEIFGLTSQLRRSAVSVPANIAEGFGRKSKLDKARYMTIAKGSLEESRYYLILSQDLKYIISEKLLEQVEEVSKMLYSFTKSLNTKSVVSGQ